MFCSKCGKTIHPTDTTCPHCQTAIGNNRFGGIPYTSAQFTIAPGQTTFEPADYDPVNNYTRTTYTGGTEPAEQGGDADSRTTYRPVYESDPLPRDLRIELKNGPRIGDVVEDDDSVANFIPGVPLSQAAKDTLSELDEELKPDEQIDRSQFKSRPIESSGRAGISRDVSEYIRQLEDNQSRKSSRRRNQEVYDDYAEPIDEEYAPQEDGYEDDGIYDEDYDSEVYEDARRAPFGVGQIVKIVVALALVAALVFGLITWIRYVRGNQSSAPIEGVSETLYEDGIALIKSHVETEYVNSLVAQYTNDGLLSLSTNLTEATQAINALMPEDPAPNDQTFLSALLAIETNIGNAVTMDALNATSGNADAASDSQANWQAVNSAISQLENAKSAAELTAIINMQPISVQNNATPAPSATEVPENYNTLSKGDENNDVLRLQVRLYELGYLTGDRDGVYGSQTATAVGLFQQKAGIDPPTGIADNLTQTRLYADDAPYADGVTTPTPAPTQTPEPEADADLIQPAEADADSAPVEGNVV